MKEQVQRRLMKMRKLFTIEQLKTDSRCKPNKMKKTKNYFRIYKQITKDLRRSLKSALSKSFRRSLYFIKLDTSEINLSLLIDELSKYERKKTNDLQKLLLKNKVIARKLTWLMKKETLEKEVNESLMENKKFLKKFRESLTYKTIPLEGPRKQDLRKDLSIPLNKMKKIVTDGKLSKKISAKFKKIIRMQEDFMNKILIISNLKLNANLPDKVVVNLKSRISEIRSLDIDINEVFYLIDVELKYQERIQKRKTDIISKSYENLNELELLTSSVTEEKQPNLKELTKLFRMFINETNKASQVEDTTHLRNILQFYEGLQRKWNKTPENKLLLQKLLNLYFQMKSNSPKNSKLLLKAFKKLGELKWVENKMDKDHPEKILVSNFTKVLESTFNNFKHELDIEISTLKILDKMNSINNSLSEDDSVNEQLIGLLPTNFELLKQLKFHVWDNENINPEMLDPVTKIFMNIIKEVKQSKEKIDLNNILLKTSLYPDTFTAGNQKKKMVKNIISKVLKARQKCFACNMIAVLNKIKAKISIDQEEEERKEDMLNDILRQIEKLQEKYEGAKEVSEKLMTIVDSLLDMFKMNYDPIDLNLLEEDLVVIFRNIEDMEEGNIPADVQLSFEDLIRKLLKFIHDEKKFKADDDEAHLNPSQELAKELNSLLDSDMNIFLEESKARLNEILKEQNNIQSLMTQGLDLMSDEDLEEIKMKSATIINNIDAVLSSQKLTTSVVSILDELKEFTEKQLDDALKEKDKRLTHMLENLFEELNSIYEGPDQKMIDDLETEEMEILDTFLKISDIGTESMSSKDVSRLKILKDKVNEILKSLLSDGKIVVNVKKVLKKIEDLIGEINERFDNLLSSKEIDERNEIIEQLTGDSQDLDKQGVIALDTIIEKLPLCNELIGKILSNGIESLTPDSLKLLRETQYFISSSLKILKNKDLNQSIKDSLKKIEDIILKDKDLILQKEHENEYEQKKDKIFDILDALKKDELKEDVKFLSYHLRIITDLQEKITSNGHESLTDQEMSSLENSKKALKFKLEEIMKNPELDEISKEKIENIGNLIEKANDSILNKMDIDKIDEIANNLGLKFQVLKNFTNPNLKTLDQFLIKFKKFLDNLKFVKTTDLEMLELRQLLIIESLAENLTDSVLQISRTKHIELSLRLILEGIKDLIIESVSIFGSTVLSLRAKSLTTLLTNLISANEDKVHAHIPFCVAFLHFIECYIYRTCCIILQ